MKKTQVTAWAVSALVLLMFVQPGFVGAAPPNSGPPANGTDFGACISDFASSNAFGMGSLGAFFQFLRLFGLWSPPVGPFSQDAIGAFKAGQCELELPPL